MVSSKIQLYLQKTSTHITLPGKQVELLAYLLGMDTFPVFLERVFAKPLTTTVEYQERQKY